MNPAKSMYGFALNRKRPGHFNLCFLANKNSYVQTWVCSLNGSFSVKTLIFVNSLSASLPKHITYSKQRLSVFKSYVTRSKFGADTSLFLFLGLVTKLL